MGKINRHIRVANKRDHTVLFYYQNIAERCDKYNSTVNCGYFLDMNLIVKIGIV